MVVLIIVASEDSLISSDEYLEFLDEHRLNYKIVDSIKNTDLTVKVEEEHSIHSIKTFCEEKTK